MKSKRIFYPLFLLVIPLIGTLVSDQVNWSPFDFLVMGLLLFILGFGIHIVRSKIGSRNLQILFVGLLIVVFLLLWAELAVGVFGSPLAGS
jgi:hypothetical protein